MENKTLELLSEYNSSELSKLKMQIYRLENREKEIKSIRGKLQPKNN